MTETGGKSTWDIIRENVFTLFNLLNLALGLCLALVGSFRNMLFLVVVVGNMMIAIIQETRARNAIRRMKLLNASKVHVIREGRERAVSQEEAVAGDLVILRAGDQVAADALVISGHGSAMESLLTGENHPIPKAEGSWLYSGSYIAEGRLEAQLIFVGDESYVGRLTREARNAKKPASGLMNDMKKLIRMDSYALVPLGVLLFLKQYLWKHQALNLAVSSSVAAMIGMIPEGLILLTSVAMAVGVVRLARKNVLVQELYGIETLARTDVLCLDKTGTITSGRMTMSVFQPVDVEEEVARKALNRFLGPFDDRSATLDALRRAASPGTERAEMLIPFASERKMSAAGFLDGQVLMLGAPEYVLGEDYRAGNAWPELKQRVQALTEKGKRVLVLAESSELLEEGKIPKAERALALMALDDELRKNVRETLAYLREEGVQLKVISGDDPRTVSRVAQQAGLEGWDRAVNAEELKTVADVEEACERYTVFGRVKPDQKRMLVEALRRKGHSVGMTGDGVNDIPAMKAADCSIAMAEGSDAARNAAQLTLMASDFGVVPDIVLEGRRVINNITRSASLFLTKTIFSLLLSLVTLIFQDAYPFQPIQMSLVSGATVGIPGFFLALESSKERIRGNFMKNVFRQALPGGLAIAICAGLAMSLTDYGFSTSLCSTVATWIAGFVGLIVLIRACLPLNALRGSVAAGGMITFTLVGLLAGRAFYLVTLDWTGWGFVAAGTALGALILLLTAELLRQEEAHRLRKAG